MINYFALTMHEMGIGKKELGVIGTVIVMFPILFVYASKNINAKAVFEWMMEKPNDWIEKNKTLTIYISYFNFKFSKLLIAKS